MWVWQGRNMQGSHTDDGCLGSALLFNPTQTHTKLSTSLQDVGGSTSLLTHFLFFFLTLPCKYNTTGLCPNTTPDVTKLKSLGAGVCQRHR